MEELRKSLSSDSLTTTLCNSVQALGRGFDVTSDIRLLYCKGAPGSRLVHLDEENTKDLVISDGVFVPKVSVDIECTREKRTTEITPVWSFHEIVLGVCYSYWDLWEFLDWWCVWKMT
ncbi:unnamed protein product [Ilex paraguariensis]|uniref:Uncharacterized protein n=1 Tax=Ilex paraguariensis TaxID=185542 RepID=A0ABC8S930_9AQUA